MKDAREFKIYTRRRLIDLVVLAVFTVSINHAKAENANNKSADSGVNSQALASLRGPFKFNMTRKAVYKELKKQLHAKYTDKIAATTDVYLQDKFRKKRDAELDEIKKSYVQFTGTKSGWEGAVIQNEFRHNTSESMMVFWEQDPLSGKNQRRFFFFYKEKLYKMFVALNSDSLKPEQRKFNFLKAVMERRFGPSKVGYFKTRDDKIPKTLKWKTAKYQAFAVDNMEVFGVFCLAIASQSIEAEVLAARAKLPKQNKERKILRSIVVDENDKSAEPSLDEANANVIDSLVK